jgi:hypothetical protein
MKRRQALQGCTVGVIQQPDGILFFKNRDLAERYHRHRLTVWEATPNVHALRGTNLKTGALEGVAIGVNRHGICVANTHVASTPDVTYDRLCEALVQDARAQDDVGHVVRAFVQAHPVQGGRILVAAPGWAILVEVHGSQFETQALAGSAVITNTFSLLPHPAGRDPKDEQSSAQRLATATCLLPSIVTSGALKSLLRSHLPEKGHYSICNHRDGGGGTESSHIIEVRGSAVTWSSLVGYPCESDYHTLPLFQG